MKLSCSSDRRRRPPLKSLFLLVALIAVQVQISASDEHDHIVSHLDIRVITVFV